MMLQVERRCSKRPMEVCAFLYHSKMLFYRRSGIYADSFGARALPEWGDIATIRILTNRGTTG